MITTTSNIMEPDVVPAQVDLAAVLPQHVQADQQVHAPAAAAAPPAGWPRARARGCARCPRPRRAPRTAGPRAPAARSAARTAPTSPSPVHQCPQKLQLFDLEPHTEDKAAPTPQVGAPLTWRISVYWEFGLSPMVCGTWSPALQLEQLNWFAPWMTDWLAFFLIVRGDSSSDCN
eukprot:CAMPEP_0194598714 /NCGR_PEP_ID=MMETSP0292-20121207/27178_1 /TAXON_ID=39354 /ORGANISM="Heterosigma akashiwo, Strain CCMP2393" /LENGTH=174 /DNA_ID=CAMNT_0039459737 /DNA_START=278 /DNA_END=803 /DNA_ORIENTATION=-